MDRKAIARLLLALIAFVPCLILLLPAFIAVAGIVAFVTCVRALASVLEPSFVPWQQLIVFDSELGWKPKPNLDSYYLADLDDVFRVVTDAEGWPGRRSLDESKVVVIGDSFAFGYGVDTGKTFADLSGLPVKAVGAPGYSMVHGVRLMEQVGTRLTGKLVVWFVYTENDLQDNLTPEMRQYRAPFVRRNHIQHGWEIVDGHVRSEPWRCSSLDKRRLFARFCVPGDLADRAYSACDFLIERAGAACRRVGAPLVVVTIPHPMQLTSAGIALMRAQSGQPASCDPRLPDRRIAESCRRYGVPMVAARDSLSIRDYKRREGIHWNERGHRRMATLVGDIYRAFVCNELQHLSPQSSHMVLSTSRSTAAP